MLIDEVINVPTFHAPYSPPLVSIALPVFNGGAALALAVESLLAQTLTDWELLIVDDGSTDGAIDRLRCLGDSRVRVIRDGLNKGLSSRLNQAVALASGRYFTRMDHDDICHPARLACQVEFLAANPLVDLLSTHCVTIDEQARIVGVLPGATSHEEICRRPWQGLYMPHPTWMGRIEWFRCHRYDEPGPYCCEDQELLLRASDQSRYHCLPSNLLAYRVRTRTPFKKLWRTRLALTTVQVTYFVQRGDFGGALLSVIAAAIRLLTDFSRRIWRWGLKRSPGSNADILEWNGLIAELKARAKVVG